MNAAIPPTGPCPAEHKTRILFVDDDPAILTGLRNALRRQRQRWDMVFVGSGEEALQALASTSFDVVVSDMRMPRMDGAELLSQVRRRQPRSARIVLSGHSEQEAIMRVLPVAHQFLIKPCDPAELQRVIERTCALQQLLTSDAIRDLVGGLASLPSVPATYVELTRAVQDDDVSVDRIVQIIERDTGMSVKVLQLVNSSYFGLAHRMTSLRQAVTYLGLNLVKALALSAHIFSPLDEGKVGGTCLRRLQAESILIARMARNLLSGSGRGDEAFTAGLVHDAGKIVFATCLGPRYGAVMERAAASGRTCYELEKEEFGFTHAEVGAYLLGIWGLPLSIVEAVAWHHAPGAMPAIDRELVAAVHVTDVIVDEATTHGQARCAGEMDMAFLEQAGLTPRLPEWRELCAAQTEPLA